MSKKLPLEIRKNYTIKDEGDHWTLKCDVCGEGYSLKKPEKGKEVHGGNILKLLDHAASHPLPKEEEEPTVAPTPPSGVSLPPLPPTHIIRSTKYSRPTEQLPNAYIVTLMSQGQNELVKASRFREVGEYRFTQVEKFNDGYRVALYAANQKHACLVGKQLIEKHIKQGVV